MIARTWHGITPAAKADVMPAFSPLSAPACLGSDSELPANWQALRARLGQDRNQ